MRCGQTKQVGDVELQCQLLLGHEFHHAALAMAPNAGRHLWRWWYPENVTREPYQGELAAGLPWAPDMPAPEHAAVKYVSQTAVRPTMTN